MSEEQLEALARKRVEARTGFLVHASMYVVANVGFIVIWAASGRGYPWFLWPLIGWGIAIVSHALALLFGPDSPRGQRAIDREMRRLHAQH